MRIINDDCINGIKTIEEKTVHCCVTSPPYWGLRDYGAEGQLGLEKSPEEYVSKLVEVFREVRRVLRDDGTLWLNLGDSYAAANSSGPQGKSGERASRSFTATTIPKMGSGLKPKDLVGIPWRVALALQADGWYLRQDIIWHKPNPMPESVTDRCVKSHEYIFLLSKSAKYFFDHLSIKEPATCPRGPGNKRPYEIPGQRSGENSNLGGSIHKIGARETRNKRSVWKVTTKPFKGAHFATFPPDLIEPCVLAGCPKDGIVLDPFFGAGTTGLVAIKNQRSFIGIEINKEYFEMAKQRISDAQLK